jgi:hypothetical protein
MTIRAGEWERTRRFYLPNEDARVVQAALRLLDHAPRAPLFVGGSGMVLLEAGAALAPEAHPTFVDISRHQVRYFAALRRALGAARSPLAMRRWFANRVYPRLARHARRRGLHHPLERVITALRELFGVELFFDDAALARAKATARAVRVVHADVGAHLARARRRYDFVYLGNVPDYLDGDALRRAFAACRRHGAPVYVLVTSACPDPAAVRTAWRASGYRVHPASRALDRRNRGLGSRTLRRPWNRPGRIVLLLPDSAGKGLRP